MFYAHFVLAKRGPLARVWLAAHWDKKLSKAQIFETDLDMSVEEIIRPKVKLALRTSGHLLLGVVRIYSRKTKYLLSDCSDAFLKIRLAFRPGLDSIDLEGGAQEAPLSAINLSEPIYDFDATVVDLADLNMQSMFTIHQGRPEDITMREDVSVNDLLRVDEFRFDDFINMADDVELFGHGTMQKSFTEKRSKSSKSPKSPSEDDVERERDREERTVLPMEQESSAIASGAAISDDFGGPMNEDPFADIDQHAAARLFEESLVTLPPLQDDRDPFEMERRGGEPAGGAPEQTTLISANDTAFLLAPVDATTISVSRRATRRKRKLVIDEVKSMSSTLMKQHMEETSDITAPLTLAPPTKKAMALLADFDSLLARPGRPIHSKGLRKLFLDNLVTRPVTDDNDNRPMHAADETMEHIDNEARLTPISEHSEPGSRASGTAVDDLLILPELEMARDDSGANESALAGAPRDSMLSMGDISLASHGFDISAAEVPRHFDGDLNDSPPPPAVKIVPEVLDKNRRVTRRSARVDRSSEVPLTPARPDVPITPVPGEVQRTPLRLDVQMTPDVSQQQRLPFENTTPRRFGSHSYSSASLRDNGSDFEEVSQASRQQQLLGLLQPHLAKAKGTVTFKKIAEGRGCRLAASQFSALLTLAKTKVVTTVQDEPFGEIVIGRGSMYSAACQ